MPLLVVAHLHLGSVCPRKLRELEQPVGHLISIN